MGLSADEYDKSGKSFIEDVLRKDVIMSKGFMNLAREIVSEGETPEGGTPGTPKKESLAERQNRELPIITGHIWPKK